MVENEKDKLQNDKGTIQFIAYKEIFDGRYDIAYNVGKS